MRRASFLPAAALCALFLCATAAAQTTVFNETFGTSSGLPAGWSVAGASTWAVENVSNSGTYAGASGGSNARADNGSSTDAAILTPAIDFSSYTSAVLSFGIRRSSASFTRDVVVEVSTDDGSTWTAFTQTVTNASIPTAWNAASLQTINLGAAVDASPQVRIRWRIPGSGAGTSNTRIDDVKLTGTLTGGASSSSDVVAVAASEPGTISSLVNDSGPLSSGAGAQVWQITVRDGGGAADSDSLPTTVNALTFRQGAGNTVANWSNVILAADLFDGTARLASATVGSSSLAFTGLTAAAPDDGGKTLSLRISLKNSGLTDGQKFHLSLASADVTTASSAASSQKAAFTTINSDAAKNVIAVVATRLSFGTQPSDVLVNAAVTPSPTVLATDANGNTDKDYATSVSVTASGATLSGSPVSATPSSGVATFGGLTFTSTGTGVTLSASSGSLNGAASNTFNVTALPRYRSASSGNWASIASWEVSTDGGSSWAAATGTPTSADGAITVRNGHTIAVAAAVSVDEVTVDSGGQITVGSGVTLTVANGSDTDLSINGTVLNSGTLTINSGAAWAVNAGASYVHNTTSSASTLLNTSPTLANTSTWVYRGDDAAVAPSISISNRTYGNLTIESTSGALSLNSNSGAGALTVNGNFSVGGSGAGTVSYNVNGFTGGINVAGSVSIGSGSTFTAGANAISVGGHWSNGGTFAPGTSTVSFNGSSQQQYTRTGAGSFNNLTLNNSGGLLLNNALAVNGTLTLTSGNITAGSNGVTIGPSGAVSRTSGHVVGNLTKTYTAAGSKTFEVGTANGYSPVAANVTAGTGSLAVSATEGRLPQISGANALARYWTLSGSGMTANLTFTYPAADVTGTVANYKFVKHSGGSLSTLDPAATPTSTGASINGVSSFSDWTLAEPSAVRSGTLQFSSAAYSVGEGGGSVSLTVTRAGGSDGAVSVAYATGGATATAGADYTAQSGTLSWAAGDSSGKIVTVPVTDDAVYEGDETFSVTLSSPGGGAALGTPSAAAVTITENDLGVFVGDVSLPEPASGQSYAQFPVTLSAASAQTVTVAFSTADGTAVAPGDYTSFSGTVTFAPGETQKTVAVAVKADTVAEPDETFGLNLSGPANASIADGAGVATITQPVAAGPVIISEFRLRGPGSSGAGPSASDSRPDSLGNLEGGGGAQLSHPPPSDDPLGGPGPLAATAAESDEFVEIYNNTDSDITVADANPVTCSAQVINVGPTTLCGWALVDLYGSVSNVPRFVIPSGTVIPARGHYLAASTGYSLSALAAPDQTYQPPAYSGAESDSAGLALFKTADRSQFTAQNVLDAVGFDGAAAPFREGNGLLPSGGVTADVQHSFVRNQGSSRPADTGDNRADFTLVVTDPARITNGAAVLGAPGPENSTGPISRNSGFTVGVPPGVASSLRTASPAVTNGDLGTLSLRRRFTNNTGQALTKLRFRVTEVTTRNSRLVYGSQAELRVLDAQLTGLAGTGLKATTVETTPAHALGGGVNSGLVVNGSLSLSDSLPNGQSIDVEFLLGVMKGGSYQYILVVEAAP